MDPFWESYLFYCFRSLQPFLIHCCIKNKQQPYYDPSLFKDYLLKKISTNQIGWKKEEEQKRNQTKTSQKDNRKILK